MMVWGCGALIIRELVRRWGGGGTSLLLGGLGLAMAQEFIIQQTSLAPMPWITGPIYGREFGVNWPFFLFLLGFEAVWVVMVPVQLTELLFPRHRGRPWLRRRGLIISCVIFLVGSFLAWFLWTRIALPNKFHVPPYHPAPYLLAIGAIVSLSLFVAAYALRNSGRKPLPRKAPPVWMAGIAALLLSLGWYYLISIVFAPTLRPKFTFWIPMAGGVVWGALAFFVIRKWSQMRGWSCLHRWAALFAATVVCMLMGFGGSDSWPRMDFIAKIVMNLAMAIWLLWLGVAIKDREPAGQNVVPGSRTVL
jgi:hypothetical protein